MDEAKASELLLQAIVDAGASLDDAKKASGSIVGLAVHYGAWFGASETDDIVLPLHRGRLYWLAQFDALARKINAASGVTVLDAEGKISPPALALRALQARLEQTAPGTWSQFVTALKVMHAELAAHTESVPRRREDRATRRLVVEAARTWYAVTGKWPSVTKTSKNDVSDSTVVHSPLLTALRFFAGTRASAALSDDKFERAIKYAKARAEGGERPREVQN